jgi:hemoglobin
MVERQLEWPTLYQRLGGHEAIAAIVDCFSRRLIVDADLAPRFAHTDLEVVRHSQAAVLARALGLERPDRRRPSDDGGRPDRLPPDVARRVVGYLIEAFGACGLLEPLGVEALVVLLGLADDLVAATGGAAPGNLPLVDNEKGGWMADPAH